MKLAKINVLLLFVVVAILDVETIVDISLVKSVMLTGNSVVTEIIVSDMDEIDGSVLDDKLMVDWTSSVDIASVVMSVVKSVTIVLSVLVEDIEIVVDSALMVLSFCLVLVSLVDVKISIGVDAFSVLAVISVGIVVLLDENIISEDVRVDAEDISVIVLISVVEDISIVVGFVVDISVDTSNVVDSSVVDMLGSSVVSSLLENINLVSGICLLFRLLGGVVVIFICTGVDISTKIVVSCSPFVKSVVVIFDSSMFVVISTFVKVILSLVACE